MSKYIVVKEPNKEPEMIESEHDVSYETLRNTVNGYIEILHLEELDALSTEKMRIVAFVNEEGKLHGMEYNFRIPYDIVVGNVIVCGIDQIGETVAISESKANKVMSILNRLSTEVPLVRTIIF